MTDTPHDSDTPPAPRETAPTEALSAQGIAAAQGEETSETPASVKGDDGDAYRASLEKHFKAQVERLPEFANDPDNLAALKADIDDTDARLLAEVRKKYGLNPVPVDVEPLPAPIPPDAAPPATLAVEPMPPVVPDPDPPAGAASHHPEAPSSPEGEPRPEGAWRETPSGRPGGPERG